MNVSAALLAGGESRRMGRDKATLSYKGQPLWQHQLDILRRLNPIELLLSARSDPLWRPNDIVFVADVPPACGPLSGLVALLGKASAPHVIILAIDMPRMNGEFLSAMCRHAGSGYGVLPMIGRGSEPLAAVYPVEALSICQRALTGTDFSLRTVARQLVEAGLVRPLLVPPGEEMLFKNLNQQTDLQEIDGAETGALPRERRTTAGGTPALPKSLPRSSA